MILLDIDVMIDSLEPLPGLAGLTHRYDDDRAGCGAATSNERHYSALSALKTLRPYSP